MLDQAAPLIPLCNSADLAEGGRAVPFDVVYAGQTCRAFAIRFEGQPQAYLNRCTHVAMEMDFQPDQFFDPSGRWLLCATHGAAYAPDTWWPVPRGLGQNCPLGGRRRGALAYCLQLETF
jgi:nitrite reductase/ring-hydroxylating ferredoxin subunit